MKKVLSVWLAIFLSFNMGIVAIAAEQSTTEDTTASIEEQLYEVLKDGIEKKIGFKDTSAYIDLSSFGLSNKEGSNGPELLRRVFKRVFYENPQFFYLKESYQRRHSGSSLVGVTPIYYETLKEDGVLEKYEAVFQAAVEEAMKQVDGVTDPVEQLLILHDFLVQHNLYNWEIAADHTNWDPWWARTAYGAMTGDCVCKGYTLAYKLLLNNLGFHSAIAVNGTGSHLWNIVELDGKWYHIDVTLDSPFPTVSGRCRHDYFLVSEKTLQSLSGNHKDWEAFGLNSRGISCDSTKYETGWAFNGQVRFPMYRKDGAYYYIARNSSGKYILYHGSLTESGKKVAQLSFYTHSSRMASGVVWLGNNLYYVDTKQNLICVQLSSGKSTSIGKIPFTPSPSKDGLCGADKDAIGLRYNAETGELVATSSTRRIDLAHFSISS